MEENFLLTAGRGFTKNAEHLSFEAVHGVNFFILHYFACFP